MRAAASVPREQRAPKFYAMSSIEDTPCTRCASLSIYTCGIFQLPITQFTALFTSAEPAQCFVSQIIPGLCRSGFKPRLYTLK